MGANMFYYRGQICIHSMGEICNKLWNPMKKHHIADQCRTTQADVSLPKNENSCYGLKLENEKNEDISFLLGLWFSCFDSKKERKNSISFRISFKDALHTPFLCLWLCLKQVQIFFKFSPCMIRYLLTEFSRIRQEYTWI